MNHSINLPGFEGQTIEVQPQGFFSSAKLLVNGQPAPKGAKRGQMLLRRNDGNEVIATWKSQFIDTPKLVVDGATINVVEPLAWYQWVWCGLPILLVFIGGGLGAIFGFIAFSFSTRIFRSEMNDVMKYVSTGVISLVCFALYLIMAGFFINLISG